MYWSLRSGLKNFVEASGIDVTFAMPIARRAAPRGSSRPNSPFVDRDPGESAVVSDRHRRRRRRATRRRRHCGDTGAKTRLLALGADLVIHSATEYLNGHNGVSANLDDR
jgi:hypothetical protein